MQRAYPLRIPPGADRRLCPRHEARRWTGLCTQSTLLRLTLTRRVARFAARQVVSAEASDAIAWRFRGNAEALVTRPCCGNDRLEFPESPNSPGRFILSERCARRGHAGRYKPLAGETAEVLPASVTGGR